MGAGQRRYIERRIAQFEELAERMSRAIREGWAWADTDLLARYEAKIAALKARLN